MSASGAPKGKARRPNRLTNRANFLRLARGASTAYPGFVLQGAARPDDVAQARSTTQPPEAGPRLGFTASKKVGNAVARNRAKRRLRALSEPIVAAEGRANWDYVLIARAETTATRAFDVMTQELREALDKLHRGGGRHRPPRRSRSAPQAKRAGK